LLLQADVLELVPAAAAEGEGEGEGEGKGEGEGEGEGEGHLRFRSLVLRKLAVLMLPQARAHAMAAQLEARFPGQCSAREGVHWVLLDCERMGRGEAAREASFNRRTQALLQAPVTPRPVRPVREGRPACGSESQQTQEGQGQTQTQGAAGGGEEGGEGEGQDEARGGAAAGELLRASRNFPAADSMRGFREGAGDGGSGAGRAGPGPSAFSSGSPAAAPRKPSLGSGAACERAGERSSERSLERRASFTKKRTQLRASACFWTQGSDQVRCSCPARGGRWCS
jgi:hypothetical protein